MIQPETEGREPRRHTVRRGKDFPSACNRRAEFECDRRAHAVSKKCERSFEVRDNHSGKCVHECIHAFKGRFAEAGLTAR